MKKYFIKTPLPTPKITDLKQSECLDSRFIRPMRLTYKQDGIEKKWDIIHSHDSVSILIYEKDLESFVIVKQFRPAVFMRNHDGYIYELCAGLVDKPKKSLEEIASEEIYEECGYKVESKRLEKITTFYTSVGISGARQTLFFVCVDSNDKCSNGGGVDDEKIEVLYLKKSEAINFINDENFHKTPALAFGINYFFSNKECK